MLKRIFERLKRWHRRRKMMLSDADRLAGTYAATREAIRLRLENAVRREQLIYECMALGVSAATCEESIRNGPDPETALIRLRDAAERGLLTVTPESLTAITAEMDKARRVMEWLTAGMQRLLGWKNR